MKNKRNYTISFLIFLFFLVIAFLSLKIISAKVSGSNENANLTIWTIGSVNGKNYTIGLSNPFKVFEDWNFYFYANFTNSSGFILNESYGNCKIRFNETGIFLEWADMNFNNSLNLWEFNRSFNYKGNLSFQTNCTSEYGNVTDLFDTFIIRNTAPRIKNKDAGGLMPQISCYEDTLFYYDFSINVSEDDLNDILEYSYDPKNTTLLNNTFSLNSSTGILLINITNDTEVGSGYYEFLFEVKDSENTKDSAKMPISVTAVNDAPVFHNLTDEQFNITLLFEKIITVTDEENNIPFKLNITFINCSVAPWSWRNNPIEGNCTLFNEAYYIFNDSDGILNISFVPNKDDVGFYTINFSVWDSGNTALPYNASTSKIVIYEVLNINSPPWFTYICDNERNATEENLFTCVINATDIDELNNLTFFTNYSWFTFNNSENVITIPLIGVGENVSAIVNFTPDDEQVGNWIIKIGVNDTGDPIGQNITIIEFFINNTEDPVYLDEIANITIYEDKEIFVNATDNDLLVPDKSVKNEILTFASNTSWVTVTNYYTAKNYTTAKITIDFDSAPEGNTSVKINVTDSTGNFAEREFIITRELDVPFIWNQSEYHLVFYEGNETYLNLSKYGYDPENDPISFSYTKDTSFPSFPLDITDGIINFTSLDEDVGQHILMINAFDTKLNNQSKFNFTIYNVNDLPRIAVIDVINGTKSDSHINVSEDSDVEIYLFVEDEDFKIPLNQIEFYNESLNLSLVIEGKNESLFNFEIESTDREHYRVIYYTKFTPKKFDVGEYTITINVTDKSGGWDKKVYTMSVLEIQHAPVLSSIEDQIKAINETLFIDFDSEDVEEGNETTAGANLTYKIENLTVGGNFLEINSTTGIINLTLNQSHAGVWDYNVSVNDSSGLTDSQIFRLIVYDYPQLVYPSNEYEFSLKENVSSELIFAFNHSVGIILNDDLNYSIYINGKFKNSSTAKGNGENSTVTITPDFTEETTCSGKVNLTVNVSNPKLNSLFNWLVEINHTNSPLTFSGIIPDSSGLNSITINLTKYFWDFDAFDSCFQQIIGYNYKLIEGSASGGIISVSIINTTNLSEGSITFSATTTSRASYYILADEYENSSYESEILSNVSSNNFTITIEVSNPRIVTTTVTQIKLAIIKLILPDPVSMDIDDKIVLPIIVLNDGDQDIKGIKLQSIVAKDGKITQDLSAYFDKDYISVLKPKQREYINLTVQVVTRYKGLFEITINATSESPVVSDWGKIYIDVKEGLKVEKRLIFLEELIASNPECIEIKEMVKEAKKLIDEKKFKEAELKIEEAIEACKNSISQPILVPKAKKPTYERLINYIVLSCLLALGLGIILYYLRRENI